MLDGREGKSFLRHGTSARLAVSNVIHALVRDLAVVPVDARANLRPDGMESRSVDDVRFCLKTPPVLPVWITRR
jgi:hypothetical protein